MSFREESIQLIITDECNSNNKKNAGFYLTEEGKKFLRSINHPLSVVSIAGAYRTGKSYLVNRLIKTKQLGFRTGASTQSVTKGLNIWGKPVAASDEYGNDHYYIVIDSEGIGSCEQEIKYDLKILTLVFLISSTVIYNSMGAIDELALDQLRVVTNLKNCFKSQDPSQKTKLVWVLRDFALQLIDRNGHEMTPNEYLEFCLEETPGTGVQTRKKNQIRKSIKENLGKKLCYTLVRPTINEEDLVDLNKAKLRTEFVGQIEAIRQEVFSGTHEDIKKIEGHPINGKLLSDLIQECIEVLNSNGLPQIQTIWESVRSLAYQQLFDNICSEMKLQLSQIPLPLKKEELKSSLNEIQNKFYIKLEEGIIEGDNFKKYHRQFLKVLQKVNKEVKKNNDKINKEKVLKDLRDFVKDNISISNIEPTNVSLLKTIVDRMELKVKGQPEGYEYVLSVLFDLIHISEQKAVGQHRELNEYKKIIEQSTMERKNTDLNTLSLKKDYHQALKSITNLKTTQEENQKELALIKHQLQTEKTKSQNLQSEWEIRQSAFLRQIQEGNAKMRQKGEEISGTLKRLREENTELFSELSQMREEKLRQSLSSKKEMIFEEKMRQTWQKIDEERKNSRSEMNLLRKEIQSCKEKYEQEKKIRQKETEEFLKDRQIFARKEREFSQQIKQIQKLHAETKKVHNATFDTLKDNDRIFRSIQNIALSNSKLATCRKANEEKEVTAVKKYYEGQLEKIKEDYEQDLLLMKDELNKMRKLYQEQQKKVIQTERDLQSCIKEKEDLQFQLSATNQRFADTVSQIETAKERERSLYQESIVRLLSNLDKRDSNLRLQKR